MGQLGNINNKNAIYGRTPARMAIATQTGRQVMKKLIKRLAALILGDYSAFHIYANSASTNIVPSLLFDGFQFVMIEKKPVESSSDELIRDQAWYHGADTHAYACLVGSRIVGLCYFWHGDRYRTRNYWPLADGEAKLVQLVTVPDMRGRGVASSLIEHASADMTEQGFHRLFARVWYSNKPSSSAFMRAGWSRVAMIIEVHPFCRGKRRRMVFWTRKGVVTRA